MFFQSISLNILFTLTAILLGVFYYYVKYYLYTYWTRRGVVQLEPTFLLGNFDKMFSRQRMSILDLISNNYYRGAGQPFIGTYSFLQPNLMVRDPEIIRNILVRYYVWRLVQNDRCDI